MIPSARTQAAIELLEDIAASTRPADGVVSFYMKNRRYIGSKDRKAILERVYAVMRTKCRLEWWLERLDHESDSRARVLAHMVLADRMGLTELAEFFGGGQHGARPLSAVERNLATRLHGQKLFHHEMADWVRGEYPQWIESFVGPLFGERMATEMGALRDEAPLDLRVNKLKVTRDEAIVAFKKERLTVHPTELSPLGLRHQGRLALMSSPAFRDGLVEVQDEGSQLVALLVDPKPGEAVCDFCAGAGGKTLALAAQMANKGRLVACDVSEGRMTRSQERMRRAGVHNVTRHVLSSEADKWVKRHAASFDRVLVDAPCSGTGTWRRNPDAKWTTTEQDVAELVVLQASILKSAARLVKPGGRLVYATCSLLPVENEQQITAFLAESPEFELVPVAGPWAEAVGSACPTTEPWLRLTPAQHGTDGFFVAVLVRKADEAAALPA